MPQKTSPFLEGKWGWNYGENNWNTGADENWLKFSYMFDRNVDGIVSTLPPAVNGQAYFNTVDNRFYFVVDGTYYSSPCPKWFEFVLRSTGEKYVFDGSTTSVVPSNSGLDNRLDTVELQLVDINSSSGSSYVGFIQDGAEAQPRDLQSKARESVSIRDFANPGELFDGTADNTITAQKAANFCAETGRELDISNTVCVITDTIASKPFLINGKSNTGTIIARNMGNKVVFDMSSPATAIGRTWGSVGVNWVVEGADIDAAIVSPKNSSQYFTYFLRAEIKNNNCRGSVRNTSATGFAWDRGATRWFHVGDCVGLVYSWNNVQGKCNIQQDPSVQMEETALELDANAAILSARIHDNNIGPIKTGISVKNRAFLTMHDNDLMATIDGIVWSGTTLFNEPKIHHNNFNAQRYGIYLDGPQGISFEDNTVRRHSSGWKGGSQNWYGFYIANSSDLKIVNNSAQADESAGAFPAMNVAYHLDACGLSSVLGNFVGVTSDLGIDLNNCTGITVDNTRTAQNAATDVLFNLTANSRRSSIGQYTLVSSFVGNILAKDATIVDPLPMLNSSFDYQTSGTATMRLTRVNSAVDNKIWDFQLGTNSSARRVLTDAGVGTIFELITRTGATVDEIQWRVGQLRLGNVGPIIKTGAGSPEGVVTAPPGSLYLNTSGGGSYQKNTGTGNTGWVLL